MSKWCVSSTTHLRHSPQPNKDTAVVLPSRVQGKLLGHVMSPAKWSFAKYRLPVSFWLSLCRMYSPAPVGESPKPPTRLWWQNLFRSHPDCILLSVYANLWVITWLITQPCLWCTSCCVLVFRWLGSVIPCRIRLVLIGVAVDCNATSQCRESGVTITNLETCHCKLFLAWAEQLYVVW